MSSDSPDKVKNIEDSSINISSKFGFVKKIIPFASVIGLLVISFLIVYLFIFPQYNSYKQLKVDIELEKQKLSSIQNRLDYLQSLYDLRDQLSANVQLSVEAIPDNKNKIPNVLDQLLQIADIAGVTVESQSLAGIVISDDPSKPKMVKVQMQLSGNRQNLIDFIKITGENRTIVDVENFSLEEIVEDKERTGFDLKLNLVTYYIEDLENLNDDETQKAFTDLDAVLNEIGRMKYYEPRQSTVLIGKDDPFSNSEQEISEVKDSEENSANNEDTGIVEE